MYIFKPLLTLTNVSGTWRSMQQKLNLDNSQHLKFSVCVNRLNNTNMASSALQRDIIQFAGERDMGSPETAHLLLGKPLYSCSYSVLCVSLDGSRRVRTGEDDDENQGDKVLDPSVLDHCATRTNW